MNLKRNLLFLEFCTFCAFCKIFAFGLSLIILIQLPAFSQGDDSLQSNSSSLAAQYPLVVFNDEILDFGDTPAQIIDNRPIVPVGKLCNKLNINAVWDDSIKTLTLSNKEKVLTLDFVNHLYKSGSNDWQEENQLFIYKNYTFAPIILINDVFKFETVTIKTPVVTPIVRIFENSYSYSISHENLPEMFKIELEEYQKFIEKYLLDIKNSFTPSFNIGSLTLRKWEQIGESLTLTVDRQIITDCKVFWSMDFDTGEHSWEKVAYTPEKPCPYWYAWDIGEHSVSAKIETGASTKIITFKLSVIPSESELKEYGKYIYVDLNGKMLTLFNNNKIEKKYPIACGTWSTPSPTGTFTIINKGVNPGGPYGTRWMGLSIPNYGIHGTNDPSSIGKNASKGCIRMQNYDVNDLFDLVPVGTPVKIFNIVYAFN